MTTIEVRKIGWEGYWQQLWIDGKKVDEFHDFDEFKLIEYINEALEKYDVQIDYDIMEEDVEEEW